MYGNDVLVHVHLPRCAHTQGSSEMRVTIEMVTLHVVCGESLSSLCHGLLSAEARGLDDLCETESGLDVTWRAA